MQQQNAQAVNSREPERTSERRPLSRFEVCALLAILLAGTALRLYRFPHIPAGLNQDELSSGYEAFSLLHTGADRWGIPWPVYFLSWGSGQNVLLSYLQIPVIALFGLTPLGVRLVPLLLGVCTLPMMFVVARRVGGAETALWATLFLAVSPWDVMLSRWSLESNLLPFFLLLGLLCWLRAIEKPTWPRVLPCLIPFVLGFYAYGISLLVTPIFLLLLILHSRRSLVPCARKWIAAFTLSTALSLPFLWFLVKNYVLKRNLPWEAQLPLHAPLLPRTRLSEVRSISAPRHNAGFLLRGFQDHLPWNQVPGHHPLPNLLLLLALVALGYAVAERIWRKRALDVFTLWLFSCVPLFCYIPVNVNQANAVFLPVIGLGAAGVLRLLHLLSSKRLRIVARAALLAGILLATVLFAKAYFGAAYEASLANDFNPGLPQAFAQLGRIEQSGTTYITPSLNLNYVQTLFYLRTDPALFQHSGATFDHPDFAAFHFGDQSSAARVRNFLIRSTDPTPCPAAPALRVQSDAFVVGRCF